MDDKTLEKMFNEFSDRGVQESEIAAAVDCLVRETGYEPTELEIAVWVQNYLHWRTIERMRQNGECTVRVKITRKGRKVAKLARSVDRIWKNFIAKRG